MFRLLLVFAVFGSVYCNTCPVFPTYQNIETALSLLSGTFYEISTTSDNVINCEKMTWSGTGSQLVGVIQSPGCCRKLYNPVFVEPNQINFTIAPLSSAPGVQCPTTTESVAYKMVTTTGSNDTLCIVFTACRGERNGAYVMCRQQVISESLLDHILDIVKFLILIVQVFLGLPQSLTYHTVDQTNCVFPQNNCPVT